MGVYIIGEDELEETIVTTLNSMKGDFTLTTLVMTFSKVIREYPFICDKIKKVPERYKKKGWA